MTGTYDQELDTLYWPVGNPGNDLNGDDRVGDNLYTDSIVALDPKTGKLKWYFQFTPHDVHDFDAMAPPALVDAMWEGKPRKLMVQANRNGFLYVLDRTNGKFLLGRPYTTKLTWATGLTPEGRPIVAPGHEPTHEGTKSCPWLNGASNWYSTSWNPLTSLYYAQTNDKCGIFTRTDEQYQRGHGYMGGSFAADPADPGRRVLRAFDIQTGKAVWELPQTGSAEKLRRCAQHRRRRSHLWCRRRRICRRRRQNGQAALELPNRSVAACFADDLPIRQQTIHCGRHGSEHHRLRPARLEERGVVLKQSRRDFVKAGSASLIYGSAYWPGLQAQTLKVPLGLQLYSVREMLPKDYAGTLKQIGALGYREVESAGYFNHSAAEVKQAMSNAGLHLVSAHYSSDNLHQQLDQILAFNKELGVSYIICSFPGFKDPSRVKNMSPQKEIQAFTLEDWRWNAEQFNAIGEKVSAAGMKFGYHNHTMEFHKTTEWCLTLS